MITKVDLTAPNDHKSGLDCPPLTSWQIRPSMNESTPASTLAPASQTVDCRFGIELIARNHHHHHHRSPLIEKGNNHLYCFAFSMIDCLQEFFSSILHRDQLPGKEVDGDDGDDVVDGDGEVVGDDGDDDVRLYAVREEKPQAAFIFFTRSLLASSSSASPSLPPLSPSSAPSTWPS